MSPRTVAETFFAAFKTRNHEGMNGLYAHTENVVFSDPIFVDLDIDETLSMWLMLLGGKSPKWDFAYEIVSVEGEKVTIDWMADYVYTQTGRDVHNVVRTEMIVRDGKIFSQRDNWDLCAWTTQAFPYVVGKPMCLLPDLTIRKIARKKLAEFMEKNRDVRTVPNPFQ